MRKILRFCAIAAVFFAMSNIIIGAAAAQTESSRPADVQTEILKSWSRKIKDATKRFEVLDRFKDEAVLDREPQLVWQREPKDKPFSSFFETDFFGAVRHCYTVTTGGRMGWRLPTAEELTSLLVETPTVNPEIPRAALPPGHPFIGITSARYWSISEGSFNSAPARYVVAPNEPEISTVTTEVNLEAIHPTWCVRGPGGGQSSREP
jgi:hypothetical protein